MRYLLGTICCFLFSLDLAAQNVVTDCKPDKVAPIRAYFEGYQYSYKDDNGIECFRMEKAYFQKDFKLSISDTTYQIVKYRFVTSLADGSLLEIIGDKSGFKIDRDIYTRLLAKMTKQSLVTVDDITISKGGDCFKVPSILCYFLK